MVSRRLLLGATIVCLLVGALGVALYAQQRLERCAYVPLLADDLLPNAALLPGDNPTMPQGWERAAGGVELRGPAIDREGFVLDGDGRSLQLIGIANYVQTPPVAAQADRNYCFSGFALTDSDKGSPTRLRIAFHWQDVEGKLLDVMATRWQPVTLWQQGVTTAWSPISAAFRAPAGATSFFVRISPASDDRVYLDAMQIRQGGKVEIGDWRLENVHGAPQSPISVEPWPAGKRAALSFTFDWETTMAGLIHSRSVGDPDADADPVQRGLRMREGITTTLNLFRPHGIRATYYAAGYNFLLGNTGRRMFLGNPTFAWASTENRWRSDRWTTTPWFADDPYGTFQSHPAWYFGDLVPILQREGQDIQSHTFSHFYGGLVTPQNWQDDITEWNRVAAERGVPAARSIAFPWSSSGGMSDAGWDVLERAGITSVTRLSDQPQYNLFPRDQHGLVIEPHCRPLPGHERILACPDFYLTVASADRAIEQITHILEVGGMIDLWAHTEEVVTPAQIAAWQRVVDFAAGQPDLWVAPLSEIADRQQAVAAVQIEDLEFKQNDPTAPLRFRLRNTSQRNLGDVTIRMPFNVSRLNINGDELSQANLPLIEPQRLVVSLQAGQTTEVTAWPAP